MNPTEDQASALKEISEWFHDDDEKTFRLGGLAGTGKSSMIPWIHDSLDIPIDKVVYVAPTNKAALVVQRRLDDSGIRSNARTVHRTYYQKMERHCAECPLTDSLRKICHGVPGSNKCGCFLDFSAKMASEDPPLLVICDESSMIGREVYDDLMVAAGENTRILFIGDHGQLEAIEENPQNEKLYGKFDLMREPDFVLEEIQRQAKDSAILKLAYKARRGEWIDYGDYGVGVSKVKMSNDLEFDFSSPEVVGITYFSNVDPTNKYHRGRIAVNDLNQSWRTNLGISSKHPIVGDRVVCRDFIRSSQISKGALGKILEIEVIDEESYGVLILLDDGREYQGLIASEQFYKNKAIWGKHHLAKWDYGYALTCHTAQGSEFDSVVVFEPPAGFRKWLGSEPYNRWLYTAITRAKRNLLLVG